MIKLSRTGITTLKRQYKSVLLKCLLINAGILLAAGNANAADTWTGAVSDTTAFMNQLAVDYPTWDRQDGPITGWGVDQVLNIMSNAATNTDAAISLVNNGTKGNEALYTALGDKADAATSAKTDLSNLTTDGQAVITAGANSAISAALVETETPGAIAAYVTGKSYQNATQVGTAISNALADYSTTAQMNTALAGKQNTIDADHKLSSTLVSFTTDETAVLGSGITSAKVSTYDGYATQIAGKLAGEEAGDYTVTGARGEALAQKIATYVADNGTKFADVKNTANIITELFNDKALYMQETTGMDQAHSAEYNYNQSTEALLHGATSMLNADEILAGAIDDKLDKTSTTAGATMELENADGLFTVAGTSAGYSNQLTIDNDENGIKLSANATSGVGKKSSLDITSEGIFYNKGTTPDDNDEIVTLNTAAGAVYNNTTSGLTATTIQGAIDETNAKFTDGSVDAKFKTVTTTGNITGNKIIGNTFANTAESFTVSALGEVVAQSVKASSAQILSGLTAANGKFSIDGTSGAVNQASTTVEGTLTVKNGANTYFDIASNGVSTFAKGDNSVVMNGDTYELAVKGNTQLDGTLTVTDATTLNSTLTVAGAATLNSTLNVADTATFGDTTGEQVVLADGVVTAGQGLVVNAGGADITGDSTIDGALSVTGQAKASSFANTNNTFTVDTAGQVKGRNFSNNNNTFVVTTSGVLTASEYHNKNNTFVVNTKGDLTANSVTTTADANIGGALTVAGATTLNDTLTVAKAATLNSTLDVADTATFGDTTGEQVVLDGGVVTADKGLVVKAGGANITGNSTITGTLHVTDAVTLDKTLDVAGLASLDGGINVNDKLTVDTKGNLTTSGVSKLNGGILVNDKFRVTTTGNVTANSYKLGNDKFVVTSTGNVTAQTINAQGKLNVTGVSNLDGGINVNDKFKVTTTGNVTTQNLTTEGTLTVAKAATLNETLTVAGATTLNDTLNVAGLTTLSADNGMRFGTGQVVKSIDDGTVARTVAAGNEEALATVATVLKSAENADYTGTAKDATGATPATVKAGLNLIGNVNSFAGGRHIAGAETLADATVALDKGLSRLEDKVRDFKKEFKSGMAQMAAMSALVPNARAHGDTQISIGTGAYEGQTAAAFGGFHWINDNLMLNVGASYGDSNNMAYRAGLTWSW